MTRTAPIRKYSADLTEDRYNIYKCYEEKLENTKEVFRSRKSKDRQSSSQKKKGQIYKWAPFWSFLLGFPRGVIHVDGHYRH
jgi:hypothetical protein